MEERKGLTNIEEIVHGFVGKKAVIRDITKNGRSRIFFDLAVGKPDELHGIFSTWRHCIVYGPAADNLKAITKGSYVEVSGFIQTVAMRDLAGGFLKESGIVMKEEHLISVHAIHIPRENKKQGQQLPLEGAAASAGSV